MAEILPILILGGAVAGLAAGGGGGPELPEVPEPVAIPKAPKVPKLEPPKPVDILSDTADRREVSRSRTVSQRRLANSLMSEEEEANLIDVKNLLGQ